MRHLLNQVTIIGMGLIGSSIARALKERQLARRVVGCSQSKETLEMAKSLGIIDSAVMKPGDSVKRSEVVILCTPLSTYSDIAAEIAPHLKPDAILTDVGSVKHSAIEAIVPHLRRGQIFIPAHPIAGSEKSGIEAGSATLFIGKKVIITPAAKHHSQTASSKISTLWEALGARTEVLDAVKHDKIYGSVSHAVQYLSYAYADTLASISEEPVANEDFQGFMRLAASSKAMWQDIFLWNNDALNQALHAFTQELKTLVTLLEEEEYDELLALIAASSKERSTHKDAIRFAAPKRSYSATQALFAYSVAVPKLIACAAFQAFPFTDYAGSGFWGFTQTLTDSAPLTLERLQAHREAILKVSQDFLKHLPK